MKKLLLVILFFINPIMHANKLSDAIRDNNPETVNLLLLQYKITPSDYTKYVAITEESIRLARERLLLQKLRPRMSPRCNLLTLGSLCAVIISSIMYHSHEYNVVLLTSPSVIMLVSILIGIIDQNHYCQQEYDNALKIQDLIFGLS